MSNVMIDLETLGVTADAVIMSIGAVQFNMEGEIDQAGAFYTSVSIDSNLALGRRIEESTVMKWIEWTQESSTAASVFHEAKVSMHEALADLAAWMPADVLVWSNGASFDIPMLEHAFRQCDMEAPWPFWNARCMRTFKNLPGAKDVPPIPHGVKHNALHDAIAQAKHLQMLHRHLFIQRVTA